MLMNAVDLMNSRYNWKVEELKLWRNGVLSDNNRVWGFTKVFSSFEVEKAFFSIWYLSLIIPRLSWILIDEGGDSARTFFVKNGGFADLSR